MPSKLFSHILHSVITILKRTITAVCVIVDIVNPLTGILSEKYLLLTHPAIRKIKEKVKKNTVIMNTMNKARFYE